MALAVVLTNGDPESVLRPGLLDALRRAGAVRLTIVGDGAMTGVVLEGWALSADAAASAVATAGESVRILRPSPRWPFRPARRRQSQLMEGPDDDTTRGPFAG